MAGGDRGGGTPESPMVPTAAAEPTRTVTESTATPGVVRAVARRAAAALPMLGGAQARRLGSVRGQVPTDESVPPASQRHHDLQVSMNSTATPRGRAMGTLYGSPRAPESGVPLEEAIVAQRAAEPDDRSGGLDPMTGPVPPGSPFFADTQPDEWITTTDQEEADRPWHELTWPDRRPERPPSLVHIAPVRPGPVALESDDWDSETPGHARAGGYAGRRRSPSRSRTWLGIGAGLIILGGGVSVPFLLHSSPGEQASGANSGVTTGGGAVGGTTGAGGELGAPTSSGPGAGGSPTAPPTGAPSQPALPRTPPTTLPPFGPVTIQAENGSLSGSAVPLACGEATVVSGIGNDGGGSPGTLTLPVTVPNAGAYSMIVAYAVTGDAKRSVQISVNSATARSVSFFRTVKTGCVVKDRSPITVTLKPGANTIRFANPNGGAPSIDNIAVSRP